MAVAFRAFTRLQDADDLSGVPGAGKGWVQALDGSMVWTALATKPQMDAAVGRLDAIEAPDWVTAVRIAANAIGPSELADGAVDTAALQDAAVTIPKLSFDPATQAEFDAEAAARSSADAALQAAVDAAAAGLKFKATVRAVHDTGNVTVSAPSSWSLGGVALADGESVLLNAQAAAAENGVYVRSGSALVRRADSDSSGEVKAGTTYPVAEGTYADHLAILTTNDPITLGTTGLAFNVIQQATDIVAGTGLTKTGNTLAADFGAAAGKVTEGNDARLTDARTPTDGSVTAGKIADGAVTSAKIADGTITDADVAAANKDGDAGTASMRTLGTGAQQATAGNDPRLSGGIPRLASQAAAGATAITLDSIPVWAAGGRRAWVVIDPFVASAELRRITSVNGATVSFVTALANTHAAGVSVVWFSSGGVPTDWFGIVGDGTTDDHDALQWAIRETQRQGLWLDGNALTITVGQPVILPDSSRLRRMTIKALAGFAPAAANNALLIQQNGSILSFTGSASTDVITTAAAHGLPADGIKVVFQGSGLPGGLVAGRVYYAYNRTSTTFKVSASLGGAIIDLTSDGAGTAFSEVRSLGKQFAEDVTIDGNAVTGLNGFDASLQQQSELRRFRINNCAGFGYQLNGQQAEHYDIEIINCGVALQLDNASFMHFFGLDIEQFNTGIKWVTSGGESCRFTDIHFENSAGGSVSGGFASAKFLDATAVSPSNLIVDDVHLSVLSSSTQVGFDMAASAAPASYDIRGIALTGASPGSTVILFRDNYIGKTVYAWDDTSNASANRSARGFIAPNVPTADSYHDEYGGLTVFGKNGQEIRLGGNQRGLLAFLHHQAGTGQTGDMHVWKDSSGNRKTAINKAAQIVVPTKAGTPTLSDLVEDGGVMVDTSGLSFYYRAGGTVQAAGGVVGIADYRQVAYRTGYYYGCLSTGTSTGAGFTNNRLYLVPFWVTAGASFDQIVCEHTAAGNAGCVARLGVWQDNGSSVPGTLILDAGTVDLSVAAQVDPKTISLTLSAHTLYWLGIAFQGLTSSPTMRRSDNAAINFPLAGNSFNVIPSCLYVDGISGAFASNPTTASNFNGGIPRVALRAA